MQRGSVVQRTRDAHRGVRKTTIVDIPGTSWVKVLECNEGERLWIHEITCSNVGGGANQFFTGRLVLPRTGLNITMATAFALTTVSTHYPVGGVGPAFDTLDQSLGADYNLEPGDYLEMKIFFNNTGAKVKPNWIVYE